MLYTISTSHQCSGKATKINLDNTVTLEDNKTIPFDYLLLAAGSSYNQPFKV